MVLGNPDVGVQNPLGCQLPEMGMAVSRGQPLSASGIVGVVHETRNPASDVNAVLSHLREVGEPPPPPRRCAAERFEGDQRTAAAAILSDPKQFAGGEAG
jgi:hypothetical protein